MPLWPFRYLTVPQRSGYAVSSPPRPPLTHFGVPLLWPNTFSAPLVSLSLSLSLSLSHSLTCTHGHMCGHTREHRPSYPKVISAGPIREGPSPVLSRSSCRRERQYTISNQFKCKLKSSVAYKLFDSASNIPRAKIKHTAEQRETEEAQRDRETTRV
jgi:hypothetical protein